MPSSPDSPAFPTDEDMDIRGLSRREYFAIHAPAKALAKIISAQGGFTRYQAPPAPPMPPLTHAQADYWAVLADSGAVAHETAEDQEARLMRDRYLSEMEDWNKSNAAKQALFTANDFAWAAVFYADALITALNRKE